jgi:two-component system response regulator YesN
MNLLIIDDQPTVIEGILVGVNWNRLTIEQKFTAHNIFEAKDVIQTHPVDLLLCDIEMPMGSGLELYEWVLEQGYPIKCIFLTSHSEFSYAQKAIHLQGFDYLLQPVTYREIEESLQKAIDRITMDAIVKNYYNYALDLKKREKETLGSVLREYLLGLRRDVMEAARYLSLLSYGMEADSSCEIAMIQLFEAEGDRWENDLLHYAIDNIWTELLMAKADRIAVVSMDSEHFILLYRRQEEKFNLTPAMLAFIKAGEQLFQCKIALYPGGTATFAQLPGKVKELNKRCRQNVVKKDGVLEDSSNGVIELDYYAPDCNKWTQYIKDGYYDLLKQEACGYLDRLMHNGKMNDEVLRRFHQDYIYLFLDAIRNYKYGKNGIGIEGENDYNYEALMNSYTSVARMKSLIIFTMNYLKNMYEQEDASQSRMDEILNYIHKNIQKNITRKDVAEAVYLNPEYLSRLFRKEKGMKLSDYILQEKMNIAKLMLETTDFSVSIIASKVGYSNFSHFAQSFKRLFGVSPSEIKQN